MHAITVNLRPGRNSVITKKPSSKRLNHALAASSTNDARCPSLLDHTFPNHGSLYGVRYMLRTYAPYRVSVIDCRQSSSSSSSSSRLFRFFFVQVVVPGLRSPLSSSSGELVANSLSKSSSCERFNCDCICAPVYSWLAPRSCNYVLSS